MADKGEIFNVTKQRILTNKLWKGLYFSLLASYCFYYAPYGINETDSGFMTGLAWQVLSGKVLYGEVIYVRPPLPVWLRAAELSLLPEPWAILGERWLLYGKVALYAWLGASLLFTGVRRWVLASLGFVVSAHCYPPSAWHTVDGILCAVFGFWFLFRSVPMKSVHAGMAALFIFGAILCKQSFYPVALLFVALLIFRANKRAAGWGIGAFLLCNVLLFSFLRWQGALDAYLKMTSGATSGGQAFEHGIADYWRIEGRLLAISVLLLGLLLWFLYKKNTQTRRSAGMLTGIWTLWVGLLIGSYAFSIWKNQAFTAPFAQSRLLFDLSVLFGLWALKKRFWSVDLSIRFGALLTVCWCASVSWGYNLPILFAIPWLFAAMEMSRCLGFPGSEKMKNLARLGVLIALLAVFRYGYEFIYRDGRRSQMTENMGQVFPQLQGIYSDTATLALYRDLQTLSTRYGPNFKTLPSFPQASYLCRSVPPLPLDWVVEREIGFDHTLITNALKLKKPVLFIEKHYRDQIETDPELHLTRELFRQGKIIEETPHFWVLADY